MISARFFAVPISAILCVGAISMGSSTAQANGCIVGNFSGGTGSGVNPFLLDSASQLTYLTSDANCYGYSFLQTADIAVPLPWDPIGSSSQAFTGDFDGGGYALSGLAITGGTSDYLGFFANVDGASLTRLNILGTSITGDMYVGVVAGFATDTEITDSSVSVDIVAGNNIGGIFGYSANSSLTGVSSTGTITGTVNVGGLVGYAATNAADKSSTITESWSSGHVAGASTVGGLFGRGGDGAGPFAVLRSYSTGNVSASDNWVGGIAGLLIRTTLTDSYTQGTVTTVNGQAGGIAGVAEAGTYSNAYVTGSVTPPPVSQTGGLLGGVIGTAPTFDQLVWNLTTNSTLNAIGSSSSAPPAGVSAATMKLISSYKDLGWSINPYFDGGTTWAICSTYNNGYPYLVSTVVSNPSGCALTPTPDPVPVPVPTPTVTPTPTPTPQPVSPTDPPPVQPSEPVFQEQVRPVAPGVEVVTGEVITVTVPVRSDSPAGTTLRNAPTVLASTNEIIRVSIDGLAASSDVRVAMRVNGRWVRLGTASTGVKGRTTLPAFETSVPGIYELRIKGKGTGTRYVVVEVR